VFLRASRIRYIGSVGGLLLQVAIGIYSLRAGVIVGGAVVVLAGLLSILFMPETGFQRRPKSERGSPVSELRTTAVSGFRYAWAAPVILLLVGVDFFMGMSSEAFDRLKEAHFLRDVGLPSVGDLDPVVWFGIFWLVGMVLGFFATGWLIKRFERGGRKVVTSWLFALTVVQMVAMIVFALTGLTWLAIGALLGVFLTRNLAEPLYTIWLNEQITDSSVRATVLSISGQADAIGQAGGGPVLGVIGNVWGIRAALTAGALVIAPALWLYGRAIAHQGREPELEDLPASASP
jgi:DHA3 family tetracycline resistance protein-like MFS transporter